MYIPNLVSSYCGAPQVEALHSQLTSSPVTEAAPVKGRRPGDGLNLLQTLARQRFGRPPPPPPYQGSPDRLPDSVLARRTGSGRKSAGMFGENFDNTVNNRILFWTFFLMCNEVFSSFHCIFLFTYRMVRYLRCSTKLS